MENRFLLWEKEIYRTIHTMLLVCVLMFGAGQYLGVADPGVLHCLIALVLLCAFVLMGHFGLKGKLIGVFSFFGVGIVIFAVVGPEKSLEFLSSYGKWFIGRTGWQQEWIIGYEILQVMLFVAGCYLVQLFLKKDFRCKLVLSCLFIVGVVLLFAFRQEFSKAGMASVLCYLVFTATEGTQKQWNKVKQRGLRNYMIWMAPLALLYLLVLLKLPVPENPYEWKTVKHLYHKVSESLDAFSFKLFTAGNSSYGTSFAGFSDKSAMGDGFRKRYEEVMTVTGTNSRQTRIYLTGKVFDTFDGKEWTISQPDFKGERYADTVRMLSAVKQYDRDYYTDYVYSADLQVQYRYLNTRYLFAPQKLWYVTIQNKPLFLEEAEGSLQFQKKAGFGTQYHAVYYQLNLGNEVFDRFLQEAEAPEDEVIRRELQNLYRETGVELTVEQLNQQEELVWEYCAEELVLSEALKNYLAEITAEADSDIEKLKALEAELSSYTYSNAPGRIPGTVENAAGFLEYFLLESREGYCNHFATAFVLLARSQGLPARYVQGYLVPVEKGQTTTVTASLAHAWPEVYIENVGWIPFEPTPGYYGFRYMPWVAKQVLDAEKREEEPKEYVSMPTPPLKWGDEEPEEVSQEYLEQLEAERRQQSRQQIKQVVKIILFSIGILFAISVLIFVADCFVQRYRYRKMSPEQKLHVLWKKNLKLLSILGFTREEGETLEEFERRLKEEFPEETEFDSLKKYEEFLYGNASVETESIKLLLEEQCKLLNFLRKRKKILYNVQYYTIFLCYNVL